MASTLTIDLRKLTHTGIGRYLANVVPDVLPLLRYHRVQLLGRPEEIAALGALPANATVLPDGSEPHGLQEQGFAFDRRISGGVLWVPHYNVPLLFRGTLVCTVHDLAPLELTETFGAGKRALAGVLLRHVARHASAILTPSEYSRSRIVQRLGAPAERVVVTPLAIDRAWPSLPNAPEAHREQTPYLLFVGNLKPNKNLTVLLQALHLLGDEAPLLLVAGKTDGFVTADEKARSLALSLGHRVRLLGKVTDDELIRLNRGAAAFVMPSLYEGFGYPVLEAMRYGCPVVCSNATSLPEVAGSAALLFDPRDAEALAGAIRRVLQPEVAQQFAEAGRLREAAFTHDLSTRRTSEVLNRMVQAQ